MILFSSYLTFPITFDVNAQVIVFTVLVFSQQILNLWFKIRTFSKSEFSGQLKIVFTFNLWWFETRVRVEETSCKVFFKSHFNLVFLLSPVFSLSHRPWSQCFHPHQSQKPWRADQWMSLYFPLAGMSCTSSPWWPGPALHADSPP